MHALSLLGTLKVETRPSYPCPGYKTWRPQALPAREFKYLSIPQYGTFDVGTGHLSCLHLFMELFYYITPSV